MNDWLDGLRALDGRAEAAALVTVIQARGSAPREPGAKMTVARDAVWDSIGGGQLEHAAIESARLLLEDGGEGYVNTVERFELGPSLGQCCGGVTSLLIERIPPGEAWMRELTAIRREDVTPILVTAIGEPDKRVVKDAEEAPSGDVVGLVRRAMTTGKPVLGKTANGTRWFVDPVPRADFHVVLFGAGHVGKALAGVLVTLPCSLTWVDSRRDQLPDDLPARVRVRMTRQPELLVDECPAGAFYLVMTHSHPLDLAVCERVLRRGDFAYCGLIGSASKRRHFEKRLRLKGITETALNRLTCPIGIDGITGKRPAEIAVAAVAQVLQVKESMQADCKLDESVKSFEHAE